MSITAIFNCDLFTPDKHIPQGLVLVEDSQIRAVGRSYEIPLPVESRLIDAQGGRVTPGLIDLGGSSSPNNQMSARGITKCFEELESAQWGLPEDSTTKTDCYCLATLDLIRSAKPSVVRALLSSYHLILVGNDADFLSTRTIRQLMASADTDFANALAAATLAPANYLELPFGRLAAGLFADMICWTRYGDLAWTMVNGEVVYP